ncbi:MAG: hypothetical protein EBS05_26720, partial [Proteobacteria bacterium]|nr:hypothetical protein [Pseudomonadota bacterium]
NHRVVPMNPPTRLRLAKEARALLPFWAACAAWITLPFCLSLRDPASYAFSGFIFACGVLGPVSVGHEFAHGTLGTLLALPIPRSQIWREKLMVTGTALVSLSVLLVGLIQGTERWSLIIGREPSLDPGTLVLFCAVVLMIPILGFCTGPALTLITRNSLGGGALTVCIPLLLQIGGVVVFAGIRKLSGADEFPVEIEGKMLMSYALGVGTVYSVLVYRSGWQWFERPEDAPLNHRELALPASLAQRLSGWTSYLLPARRGVMTSLLRKELRLQQPAFLVAAFFLAFWLTSGVLKFIYPPLDASLLLMPAIFLCLAVPVTVGIVSTAEERSLGIHEWLLTLPVSARRQWWIKVLVAISVNAVLGLALPVALALVARGLDTEIYPVKSFREDYEALLACNTIILFAALYASTGARNGLSAVVGTVALVIIGPLTICVTSWILNRPAVWLYCLNIRFPNRHAGWPSPEMLGCVFETLLPLGWVALAGWFGSLAFANFRRTLAAGWQPVWRLVPVFVGAGLWIMGIAFITVWIGKYEWNYNERDGLRDTQWQKLLK